MAFLPSLGAETWVFLVTCGALLLLYGIWPYNFFRKLGIPGPRPLPFIGTYLEYRKGMLEFDLECSKKYGKIWGLYEGRQPILAILDPDLIKTVLVKEFYTAFTNRRNLALSGNLKLAITEVEDEMWKRIRAIISPTFSSGKLKEMFPLIKHHGDILMKNIEKKVAQDEVVNVSEIFGAYSLDVITSTSFGIDTDSINNPDDIILRCVKKAVSVSFLSPLIFLTGLFPFLVPLLERMNVTLLSRKELDFFVNVTQRLKEQRQASGRSDRVDLLQLMIDSQATVSLESSKSNHFPKALTDVEITAQSIIFIFAGFETSSLTLSFIAYNLATHPEVQEKLQEEIDSALPNKEDFTYDALFQMEYLDMVVNETLRLFPLGGRLERVCKKTIEINGVTVPKGTVVVIPTYVLHRDPAYWPEPEKFCPERFSKDNKKGLDPYVFLPFGIGPRNCIGMRFSLLSLKAALVLLLQNFSLEICKETPIPLELNTNSFMVPKKPIFLKLTPRTRVVSQE
ncbi:cytochrome P450 3A9-like [Loxodonta africana]|uniref:cytochrome P450 3A9-like n=1 Tax=Loxodonta africana TaxID=9785 RepID=UPI000223552A|nr:cytochrome P450 3A9-like [Loxodonta africana]XP_049760188.1 cytochrome P450 3A9-like isoform X2 [Elephas maximus indicus]